MNKSAQQPTRERWLKARTARTLSGPSVTFVAVSNGQPDDVLLMLPSAKPWTKTHPERLSER